MKILALTGTKGVGKSYVAREMKSELMAQGYNVDVYSFAQELRIVATYIMSGLDMQNLHSAFDNKESDIMPNNTKPRDFMIDLSEKVIKKHFGNEIWCSRLLNIMTESDNDICIIDDARFDTEIEYLSKNTPADSLILIEISGETCYTDKKDFSISPHLINWRITKTDENHVVWKNDVETDFMSSFTEEL